MGRDRAVQPAFVLAFVLLLLTAGVSVSFSAEAAPGATAEFDAKYVKMEIPKQVLTDQVFLAKITIKNTGSQAWKEASRSHTCLRSQDPQDNLTWGTNYIIQGQGTEVKPGEEFTFTSNLKAPSTPGEAGFKWRAAKATDGVFFGEATAREVVRVEKRPEPPPQPPPLQARAGKHVLAFEDFEYAGSFKVPAQVGGGGAGYSESGLALRKTKDGGKRLFMNYTHPHGTLFEVGIPGLVKVEDGNHAPLKTAEVRKVWGPIGMKIPKTGDVESIGINGGFWWDESKRTLYWTWYHGYWTGGALPILGASRLEDDGKITYCGPWIAPNMKHHWGGVTKLSKDFADQYTGGRTLALGFGGYYSICGPCSRGPALGAVSEPDPAKATVDLVALLAYANGAIAPRDGDYFSANCGFWAEPPDNPMKGYWTYDDWSRSGVFISLPDKHGYIAFVRLGTGRLGYDYGSIGSAGASQYWYFYNPEDLGEAAKGMKKAGDVMPQSRTKVTYPGGNGGRNAFISGSCFDEEERLLYLFKTGSIPVGRECHPCVHVYRVR